jgi:hypothetical protein
MGGVECPIVRVLTAGSLLGLEPVWNSCNKIKPNRHFWAIRINFSHMATRDV